VPRGSAGREEQDGGARDQGESEEAFQAVRIISEGLLEPASHFAVDQYSALKRNGNVACV
jgi:hypothetical protein